MYLLLLLISVLFVHFAPVTSGFGLFTLQEIFKYHQAISIHKPGKTRTNTTVNVVSISNRCQEFLVDLLYKKPALGHTLVQSLIVQNSSMHERNNLTIYNVYLQCLYTLLSEIGNSVVDASQMALGSNARNTSYISRNDGAIITKFYDVLSLFDPPRSIKGLSLAKFLDDLCNICNVEGSPLKLDSIYSCLMGKSSQMILDEFCEVLWIQSNTLCGNVVKGSLLTDVGKTLLGLCQKTAMDSHEFPWKDLYLLCLRHQRHFLDTFIVSYSRLNLI